MSSAKAEFTKSNNNSRTRSIADRMAVVWVLVFTVGVIILSFGRSRESTIIGAEMVGLAFGIILGYSIAQKYIPSQT
jgi:uncharacterized membrane protein